MNNTKHQIYVSYAEADEDWVIEFIKNLKVYLRKQLGEIDDNFIWGKYKLRGIDNESTVIQEHLRKSKYLFVVLSNAYLRTIGETDIEIFGDVHRIIVVEHYKVVSPPKLTSNQGYKFWIEDERGNIQQYALPKSLHEDEYYQLLGNMSRDIAELVQLSKEALSVDYSSPLELPKYVVITVTNTEDKAFRDLLKKQGIEVDSLKRHKEIYYTPFQLETDCNSLVTCAIIRLEKKGGKASQSLASDLAQNWKPQLIIMTGVCGGVGEQGVKLNDVIFANSVFDYESERLTDDAYRNGIKPQQYHVSQRLQRLVANIKTGLSERLKAKIHHERSLASGDKVFAQLDSKLRKKVIEISSDIYGFEMEGHGLLYGLTGIDTAIIKAVSDLADENMQEDKDNKQLQAATLAAQVTIEVMRLY